MRHPDFVPDTSNLRFCLRLWVQQQDLLPLYNVTKRNNFCDFLISFSPVRRGGQREEQLAILRLLKYISVISGRCLGDNEGFVQWNLV